MNSKFPGESKERAHIWKITQLNGCLGFKAKIKLSKIVIKN